MNDFVIDVKLIEDIRNYIFTKTKHSIINI